MVFNFVDFTPLYYGDYKLPDWAQGLGLGMAVAAMLFIPIIAIYKIIRSSSWEGYEGLSVGEVRQQNHKTTHTNTTAKEKKSGNIWPTASTVTIKILFKFHRNESYIM